MVRACSTNGEKRNAYMILVGKPKGKSPLGRPRSRWVDNIKMDLREMGFIIHYSPINLPLAAYTLSYLLH
jgi:hypothetical protein